MPPGVAAALAAVSGQSPEVITADLTATSFCDSAGVEALAGASQRAATAGAELRLAIGDSPVARILQLTGLDAVMPIYRDAGHSLATPPGRLRRKPDRAGRADGPAVAGCRADRHRMMHAPAHHHRGPGRARSDAHLVRDLADHRQPAAAGPAPAGTGGIAELPPALVSHLDEHLPGAFQGRRGP